MYRLKREHSIIETSCARKRKRWEMNLFLVLGISFRFLLAALLKFIIRRNPRDRNSPYSFSCHLLPAHLLSLRNYGSRAGNRTMRDFGRCSESRLRFLESLSLSLSLSRVNSFLFVILGTLVIQYTPFNWLARRTVRDGFLISRQ